MSSGDPPPSGGILAVKRKDAWSGLSDVGNEEELEEEEEDEHPGYGSLLGVAPRTTKKKPVLELDPELAEKAAQVMELNAAQLMKNPDRAAHGFESLGLDPLGPDVDEEGDALDEFEAAYDAHQAAMKAEERALEDEAGLEDAGAEEDLLDDEAFEGLEEVEEDEEAPASFAQPAFDEAAGEAEEDEDEEEGASGWSLEQMRKAFAQAGYRQTESLDEPAKPAEEMAEEFEPAASAAPEEPRESVEAVDEIAQEEEPAEQEPLLADAPIAEQEPAWPDAEYLPEDISEEAAVEAELETSPELAEEPEFDQPVAEEEFALEEVSAIEPEAPAEPEEIREDVPALVEAEFEEQDFGETEESEPVFGDTDFEEPEPELSEAEELAPAKPGFAQPLFEAAVAETMPKGGRIVFDHGDDDEEEFEQEEAFEEMAFPEEPDQFAAEPLDREAEAPAGFDFEQPPLRSVDQLVAEVAAAQPEPEPVAPGHSLRARVSQNSVQEISVWSVVFAALRRFWRLALRVLRSGG